MTIDHNREEEDTITKEEDAVDLVDKEDHMVDKDTVMSTTTHIHAMTDTTMKDHDKHRDNNRDNKIILMSRYVTDADNPDI